MLRNPEPSANLGRLDDRLLYYDSRVCTTLRGVSKSGLARWPIFTIGFFHESLVAKPLDGRKSPGDSRLSRFKVPRRFFSFLSSLIFRLCKRMASSFCSLSTRFCIGSSRYCFSVGRCAALVKRASSSLSCSQSAASVVISWI
jgi:hypothetical protein